MSNIYDIDQERKAPDQRRMEASAWIAKMDNGLRDAEADALRTWMRADPQNEAELLEMARMWDKMDALARLSEVFPRASEARPAPIRHRRQFMAIAASFVFVLAASVFTAAIMNSDEGEAVPNLAFDAPAYETAIGGISTIELSDGSRITLNTNSRAVVSFSERQRIVKLERGEMHIDVAHDRTRPLSVVAGGRIVQAVGTAFSVKIDGSRRVEVLVADGRVRVGVHEPGTADLGQLESRSVFDGQSLLVAEGERVVLNADGERVEVLAPEEIEVRLSWRNGNLIFRGESLAAAVEEVSRYTTVDFAIPDRDLQTIRVAGLFKAGDVAGFLSTLQANFDVVSKRADRTTIVLTAQENPTTDASH